MVVKLNLSVIIIDDKKRVDEFELSCYRRLRQGVLCGAENDKWVMDKIGSVLMLRKSMAERKMRFFGHIRKQHGKNTDTGEDGRQAAKGQTCKDLVPGFKRLDLCHGACITGD